MSYILSAVSDCGFRHSVNQDSVLVRKLQSAHDEMVFACICDGMGGLQYGELASATLVSCFDEWLDTDLPEILSRSDCEEELRIQWQALIDRAGNLMRTFTMQTGVTLGTTLSALLLWQNRGFIANIGDTRVYKIGKNAQVLTRDHTFVREEINAGRMTPEQAACSGKEHILTRCVGVREDANADFYRIPGKKKSLFLLCSDGFRHKISPEEMHEQLSGKNTAADLEKAVRTLILHCRERGEKDDISVVTILVNHALKGLLARLFEKKASAMGTDSIQTVEKIVFTDSENILHKDSDDNPLPEYTAVP